MEGRARHLSIVLVCSLAVLPVCGCRYIGQRASDLGDILILGGSTGSGVVVRAMPTRLLALDFGMRKDETFYGRRQRSFRWVESSQGFLFASFWTPRLGEEPPDASGGGDALRTLELRRALYREGSPRHVEDMPRELNKYHLFVLTKAEGTHPIDVFDVELDVSALIVGVQLALSPGQLVDFLAGIFTLDLAGDDVSERESQHSYPDGTVPRDVDPSEAPAEDSRT